jgi:hypothetical protein
MAQRAGLFRRQVIIIWSFGRTFFSPHATPQWLSPIDVLSIGREVRLISNGPANRRRPYSRPSVY